jgi:hypothetical protein
MAEVRRMTRPVNSRRKGARGELEFIQQHLAPHWPDACRNLDQFKADKRDCLNVAGVHWQIKRTERLDLWAAIHQAQTEAAANDVPVVAFRRNRSGWNCIVTADELIALLRLKDKHS